MKQDYARTVGYLALLILFIQILPFGPLFRVIATAVCSFILIGIAFSISNFAKQGSVDTSVNSVPKIKKEETERVSTNQAQTTELEPEEEQLVVIEEFEIDAPAKHYEEREQ